jgi:putative transposase
MPQSLVKNYIHTIFSTKNRLPMIDTVIEKNLHTYIGGICNRLECEPIMIGGHVDHIHILSSLSKKLPLIEFIEEVKGHSSRWIKTKGQNYSGFYWQKGYGAFSVNPSELSIISEYVSMQKEHHAHKTFQDEYRQFLRKYQVLFNEQYVWD